MKTLRVVVIVVSSLAILVTGALCIHDICEGARGLALLQGSLCLVNCLSLRSVLVNS